MEAIETKHLTKVYKTRIAVDDLTFSIKSGEFFALLGFNGAGKTTTIKMLSGLTKPSSGSISILGKHMTDDLDYIKKNINVSPQETAIAPNLTVYENLVFIARIYGFSKEVAAIKANEMMLKFKLEDRKNEKSKKLSGGLKRRLSIAMALVTEPKIIFLDEPTLGLDVRARRELWYVLNALRGEVTMILTTHYLDEVEALADRIAILDKGQLKIVGSLEDLKKKTKLEKLEDIFITLTGGAPIL